MNLNVGANAAVSGSTIKVDLSARGEHKIGESLGLVWLALDAAQKPVGTPAYLQTPTTWATAEPVDDGALWVLGLNEVPAQTQRLLLVLYHYGSSSTLGQVQCQVRIKADEIEYAPALNGCTDSAMIVLEVYRRESSWKVRALAEGSPYGLAALGRRLELALDEKHPSQSTAIDADDSPDFGGLGNSTNGSWTGTAFAISPTHLLTCAHVVRGASLIEIDSLLGKHAAQCVAHDTRNDVAILKVQDVRFDSTLPIFARNTGQLGEAVTALGYPLSSMVGNHLQVTQGCISSLRGFNEDCGFLQFTAPIQPGSSGSPLLNHAGVVVGMVTSTLTSAQNMNFAVKHYLLLAMLEAVGLELPEGQTASASVLSHPQLVKQTQHAIWHVSCQGVAS